MKINDDELINQALKHKDDLNLHKDTIKKLNSIKTELGKDPNKSFREKSITTLIIDTWPFILQDSIYNLKCFDSREDAYHTKKTNWRKENLDLNNQFVFGLDRLQNYFREFTEFESVLYGVDGNYRDHVIHVFRVWLLGITLILNDDQDLAIKIQDLEFERIVKGKSTVQKEEVVSMWAIIALCHDLGYPLEKAEKVNESVERMYRHLGKINIQKFSAAFHLEHQFLNKFLLDFISSKVECQVEDQKGKNLEFLKAIEEKYDDYFRGKLSREDEEQYFINPKLYQTAIQTKYFIKFAKSLEYYSHGIISCTILLKSLFYFLESDFNIQERTKLSFEDARQFFIRREILRSIAAHTCPEVYHLKVNTLPFLLILCDELQEWGRPRFDELHSGSEAKPFCETEIVECRKDKIKFSAKYYGVADSQKFAKKIFRRWHEILRSAVYDTNRKFTLEIDLDINGDTYDFIFKDNVLETNCTQNDITTDFRIYELKPGK